MNPSTRILFHSFIFFAVFTAKAISIPRQTISYADHCNSHAPEAIPTDKMSIGFPFLKPVISHYTGGQNILDLNPSVQRSTSLFEATDNSLFRTNIVDTYKIQATLSFFATKINYFPSNYSRVGWIYRRRPLVFYLDGFWSVSTSKLCMVGSAQWFTKEGKPLKLDAVLKLKLPWFTTLNSSLVSGILESLAHRNNSDYFDTISLLGFPQVPQFGFNYTLVSNQECNVPKTNTLQDSITSMRTLEMCTIFMYRFTTYELKYPSNCKNCSLFGQDDGYLPTFVSLYGIECFRDDKKLWFLVEFLDRRFTLNDQSFRPDVSLIGEGTWKGKKDGLCIVACRVFNQSDPLGSAHVGDCSIRLTLWFPAVWSIKKTHTTEGQIWSTKLSDDSRSFRMVKFQSSDHSEKNYGMKYEYTRMKKVRRICTKKKRVGRGDMYPSRYYYNLDISVKHRNMNSSGSAVSIFVGARGYNDHTNVNPRIHFEISFILNISSASSSGISSLNLSSADNDKVKVSAEGLLDDATGHICMVGCRNLIKSASFDCEILVKLQLPQVNGSLMKGSIESLREKGDVLYFEQLDIVSLTVSASDQARELIWRMDLEFIMVLISDTLMCVFIGRQLVHLKKRPEMVNSISVLMMLILTLGHMVPLVLNFEAIFSNTTNQQSVLIGSNGLLEVIVSIVTMLAFILQFRLLHLSWIAKKKQWVHEIRTLIICLPMYIIGVSAMLLVNSKNNNDTTSSQLPGQSQRSFRDDLKSYAALALDGFLCPQLILNIFQISKGSALSHSFYIGTTFVRLLPHAYDFYTGQTYTRHQFDRLYIYANPRANIYSPSWDIIIACASLVFAVTIFLQQCFGGRFMFPKRFHEHVEYYMVAATSNET